MTSPEKIEQLLNVFDVSLKDLPRPKSVYNGKTCMAYEYKDRQKAEKMALRWHDPGASDPNLQTSEVMKDFILHQSDVIEKLVRALSIAEFDVRNAMRMR